MLDVNAQVRRLIRQATSHENLCMSYVGWCGVHTLAFVAQVIGINVSKSLEFLLIQVPVLVINHAETTFVSSYSAAELFAAKLAMLIDMKYINARAGI